MSFTPVRPAADSDTTTRWFGDIRVDAIDDMDVQLASDVMWKGRGVEPDRPIGDLARDHPREFSASGWRFVVRCFLIRSAGATVLVDAAVGPGDRPLAAEFGIRGGLLDALSRLGVAPADVDDVVITHAHDDHVGWITNGTDDAMTFARAAHHIHAADLELARAVGEQTAYWSSVYAPLERSGLLHTGDNAQLAPGVVFVPTAGHTPGHRCVVVRSGYEGLLITGDLLHFAYQLEDLGRTGPFDRWPEAAVAGRRAAFAALAPSARWTVGSAHLPDAFTDLAVVPGRVTAQAAPPPRST